ncbi:hypothetical protein CYMTET_31427 [Cymbomonas tetramitiformis]|uniref:Uncharacterized protein n=1 Tax=Cymbomonas tetramitiformis TaxID=36881 RepID=A0AAE0FGU2_9CHLO|nr:hypothetical protein CYMTET_31427 [Cymbomonas tetramitiformis]|eukprot:gene1968-2652_t
MAAFAQTSIAGVPVLSQRRSLKAQRSAKVSTVRCSVQKEVSVSVAKTAAAGVLGAALLFQPAVAHADEDSKAAAALLKSQLLEEFSLTEKSSEGTKKNFAAPAPKAEKAAKVAAVKDAPAAKVVVADQGSSGESGPPALLLGMLVLFSPLALVGAFQIQTLLRVIPQALGEK